MGDDCLVFVAVDTRVEQKHLTSHASWSMIFSDLKQVLWILDFQPLDIGNHSRSQAYDIIRYIVENASKSWMTQNLVSPLLPNNGMAVWQWWVSSLASVLSCWLAKASCIRLDLGKYMQDPDVWAPDNSAGYYRLFFFGSFIAALGVGANTVGHYLWASIQAMNNYF